MITYNILAGTVDVSVVIRIIDAADGTPETGVVFNTTGIDLEYRRETAASVDITEATLAALTTAHTDGGFLHIGNGYYRLDLPDAACAAGVSGVLVHGTVTDMVVIGCYINLTPVPADVRQWLGTAAATPSVGGVPEVDLTHVAGATTDVSALATNVAAILVDTGTTLDGKIDAIDNFLDTEIADILEDTGTTIPGLIAALNNLSAAQVNAEVLDVMNVDTFAQPGQGTPAATTTMRLMLAYLYKAWRNRHTQDASEYALYNDDGTTKDQEAAVTDDGTTFDRGEVATGA